MRITVLCGLLALCSLYLRCEKSNQQRLEIAPQILGSLHALLADMEEQYDPAEKMLKSAFSSPGYHTSLTEGMVHRTRQSLTYAASCLDSNDPQLKQRGLDIIERVIRLQDQDSSSATYGIWPWFLEEPLDRMSPPDWNWADFCGVQLLQAIFYHQDRFSNDLLARVNSAIYHAARSIQRRNVGPGYTNIAIMGTYVTMMTAELQNVPDLKQYALNRLQRFYDYTKNNGAFNEYNSPTYTIVALKELARMQQHFQDAHARSLVAELYALAWEEIAIHFHPPTQQWAGPHSRSYSTFLPKKQLAFIQTFTSNAVQFKNVGAYEDLEAHRLECACPQELEHYFIQLQTPRQLERIFAKDNTPLIGKTYLCPSFCLGTINRGDLWNQRRPLIAYWGEATHPSYLRLRFLHDDYDFAAAQFFSAQEKGNALYGLAFATDGGDTHINLDMLKDATFTAHDLRLRFECGGRAADLPLQNFTSIRDTLLLEFPDVTIKILLPFAEFDGQNISCQSSKVGDTVCYDVIFYSGPTRQFNLTTMQRAAVAGFVCVGSESERADYLDIVQKDDTLVLNTQGLKLTFQAKPATRQQLHERFDSHITEPNSLY
ncbi:hypothetical protein JXA70_05320 [candidate division KSB1 bacterium]|nr:hypothetical protein [candidate division KSB1 bacterium]